jgi:hypothetical protein
MKAMKYEARVPHALAVVEFMKGAEDDPAHWKISASVSHSAPVIRTFDQVRKDLATLLRELAANVEADE